MALEKRISELTAKVGAIEDTDLMVISDYNGATYDTKKVTGAQIKPYKVYMCSISQSGTSAPIIDSSYSELTSTFTFSRLGVGQFAIDISGTEFTLNKTFCQISNGELFTNVAFGIYRITSSRVIFYCYDTLTQTFVDSYVDRVQIEIKIIK